MLRQIKRNIMKRDLGTNKIQARWRRFQIKRYGIDKWLKMFNQCTKNKLTRIRKSEAYL